jgi:hypothetical protein
LSRARSTKAGAQGNTIADKLFAAGAELNTVTSSGRNLLHVAASNGLVEWLKRGIDAGLPLNLLDADDYTPLLYATEQPEAAKVLLASGAEVDAVGYRRQTPLLWAVSYSTPSPEKLEFVSVLLEAGANPNAGDGTNRSVLHYVTNSWGGNLWAEGGMLLLKHGADPRTLTLTGDKLRNLKDEHVGYFEACWELAHHTLNEKRSEAIWFSQRRPPPASALNPTFGRILSVESAVSEVTMTQFFRSVYARTNWSAIQGTSRFPWSDFSKVAVFRRSEDGASEEKHVINYLVFASGESGDDDFVVKLGDIVELPRAAKENSDAWDFVQKHWERSAPIHVKIQIGKNHGFTNEITGPGLLHLDSESAQRQIDALRAIPYQRTISKSVSIERTLWDGGSGRPPSGGRSASASRGRYIRTKLLHGDTIHITPPEPKTALSERAMQQGVYVCPSLEGPYWPVRKVDGVYPDLAGLIVALSGPTGLPQAPIDWSKARFRQWSDAAKSWSETEGINESTSTEIFRSVIERGTMIVAPPIAGDSYILPDGLRKRLTELRTFTSRPSSRRPSREKIGSGRESIQTKLLGLPSRIITA